MVTARMLEALTANSLDPLRGVLTTPPAQAAPVGGVAGGVPVEPVGVFRRDDKGRVSFESYASGRWFLLDAGTGAWRDGEAAAGGAPAAYAYADRGGNAYAQTARGWMIFDPVAGWVRLD